MKSTVFRELATNPKEQREELDYYATDPKAAELLLSVEKFNNNIWECACGEKHLSKVFENHGYNVRSSDIVNRCDNEVIDFLATEEKFDGDIITNPPYKYAQDFILKALDVVPTGNKVAMFLKVLFLEGKKKYKELFKDYPPTVIYISSGRINCARNGDFDKYKNNNAVAYAWYIWEKGFKGNPIIKWI